MKGHLKSRRGTSVSSQLGEIRSIVFCLIYYHFHKTFGLKKHPSAIKNSLKLLELPVPA